MERFPLAAGQRGGFWLLAACTGGFLVAGAILGNGIAIGVGVFFALLAGFIGRQAFGPPAAYEIDADGFRHMRGDTVELSVPWTQVTQLGVITVGRVPNLAFEIEDLAQVTGAEKYRHTRKLTGKDIVVNFGPLGVHADDAAEAARAAWLAATA